MKIDLNLSNEEKLKVYINSIKDIDENSIELAKKRWNSIAKPLKSLGIMEEIIIKCAGIYRNPNFDFGKKAVIVMCGDNGVVEEGVTQTSSDVTAIVAENFTCGKTSLCAMSEVANADIFPVNIGILNVLDGSKTINKNVKKGTNNFAKGLAMSRQEVIEAILVGIEMVGELKENGYNLIATGEMGIGNTTTSSAIVCTLLDVDAKSVTGVGAGLSSSGLEKKISVVENAIKMHKPDKNDIIDILSKVGGLDIAGLVGVFIGGGVFNVPIIIDGIISATSALLAKRCSPNLLNYMIASHVSAEPAGKAVLDAIGIEPFIFAKMCLGEGTGAVLSMPMIEMGKNVYDKMSTFNEISIDEYEEFNNKG